MTTDLKAEIKDSAGSLSIEKPLLWISASAGSGKTYRLASRFVALLMAGVPIESIVATTFTRKAAGEIFEKVLERLTESVRDEQKRAELAKAIGRESVSRDMCLEALNQLLNNLHRLRIGTIDSLFAQVARCYGLELKLPHGWTICDEYQADEIRDRAIDEVLIQNDEETVQSMLHLLAKGETDARIGTLIRDAVKNGYATYRDSLPAAWDYLKSKSSPETTAEELANDLEAVRSSFPDFEKCIEKDLARWNEQDWEQVLKTGLFMALRRDGEPKFNRKPIPDELVDCYRPMIEWIRAEILQQLSWQTKGTFQILEAYDQQLKLQQQAQLGFNDIPWYLSQYLSHFPAGAEGFAFRMDGRVDHWLLDEFQDTSAMQWRVLRAMVLASRSVESRSFFCVGDAKQAIYRWRASTERIFRSIPNDKELGDVDDDQLVESWRSAPTVIETVNCVFKGMVRHNNLEKYPAIAEWSRNFSIHTTHHTKWPGYAELRVAEDSDSVLDEAVEQVDYLHRAEKNRSIGILVRKNSTVAELRHLLARKGIRASEEGGNYLTDSPAVSWLRAWLQVVDHPQDKIARFQLCESPMLESADMGDDDFFEKLANDGRRRLMAVGYGRAIEELVKPLAAKVGPRDARRLEQLVVLAYEFEPEATLRTREFLHLVDSRRISDPNDARVRVMTIHQAKGLEFDSVVLPELDVALSRDSTYLVTHRPGPSEPISKIFRRPNQVFHDLLGNDARAIAEQEKNDAMSEQLCNLYVALTRAVYGIYMIVAPHEKEKHLMQWSGLLRASLADGKPLSPGTIAYEKGDSKWFQKLVPADHDQAVESPEILPAFPALKLGPARPKAENAERVAPSRKAHSDTVSARSLLESSSTRGEFGTVIHFWFEQIQWLEDAPLDESVTRLHHQARQLVPHRTQQEISKWWESFQRYLDKPRVADLLKRESYEQHNPLKLEPPVRDRIAVWQVECERPVHFFRSQDELTVGVIDRLVLGLDEAGKVAVAQIIDYKTDRLDSAGDLERLGSEYQIQLDAYADVIAQLFQLDRTLIDTELVFLRSI